ncbi:hypothetical protein G6F37_009155 [Rhizopus arrhizus]|nr:hypothetical protein G6F38_008762 [Rhizopus arrhizus]KAG1154764.1 hypothetical protein G6F37_009155 [Rhizopus arrhizus]
MSSSLHFADDFIKSEIEEDEQVEETLQRADGIYVLTRTIDKLFAQLKVSVTDTVIHIIHTSAASLSDDDNDDDEQKQYSIDICIPGISYFDETPEFNKDIDQQKYIDESSLLLPPVPNETIKIITIEPPSVWLRSVNNHVIQSTEMFYEAESSPSSQPTTPTNDNGSYESLLFTTLDKNNWIRIKTIPLDENAFHIKQVDFLLTHLRLVLTPKQIAFFLDLVDFIQDSFTPTPTSSTSSTDILGDLDVRNQQKKDTLHRENTPEQKVKIKISRVECFLLTRNSQIILNRPKVDLHQTHIRFVMDQLNIRMQRFINQDHCINLLFLNLELDEWVQRPSFVVIKDKAHRTRYNCYQPIIQFDNSIMHNYSDEDTFPSFYDVKEQEKSVVEVIRVKVDKKRLFMNGSISLNEDIHVDIQAFKLYFDPRIINRFDTYIHAFINRKPLSQPSELPRLRRNTSNLLEDLLPNRRVQVKCAFIRLVLLSPDMSQATSRYDFNDKNHENQLSVDVKKAVVFWSTSPTAETTKDIDEKESAHINNATRMNIELNFINIFIKEDTTTQCWFTAKTIQDMQMFSEATLCPSIEITVRDPQSIYHTRSDTNHDMPHTLFDGLKEGNTSIENQSDSALIFKQRTIETSQFVMNCHLPVTHMNLTKEHWDKIQIIQNDLLLWQPRFLLNVTESDTEDYNHHYHHQKEKPSLLSLVAVLSQCHWRLHTSPTDLYTLQFSEFKYFACMKHMGKNENITTLDIEELALYDNLIDRELFCKAMPKIITPSRSKSMVSIFSRLSLYPDINKISKETSIVAGGLCWKATPDIGFIEQLVQFQQAPEEMVFIDPPKQHIKIYAHVVDTSINYEPNDHPSKAIVLLDGIQLITNIMNGQPMLEIKVCVGDIQLLLLDHPVQRYQHIESSAANSRQYWLALGFVPLVSLQSIELEVKLKMLEHLLVPKADVAITSTDIYLDTSSDSFQSLVNLMTHLSMEAANESPTPVQQQPRRASTVMTMRTINELDMLASIDENAFKTAERRMSPPTLIEMPEIEDYVEEFYSSPGKSITPPIKPRRHIKRTDDIIRLLATEKLEVIDDFYGSEIRDNTTTGSKKTSPVDLTKALLSLRVHHANVIWRLYEGYDWDYVRAEMAARKHDRKAAFTDQGGFDGRQRQRQDVQIEIQLTEISVSFDLMPSKEATDLYFQLNINDMSVIDNIKTSAWKKLLGYMKSAVMCREDGESMVHLELTSLRPIPDQQELRLKVKLLPIRLYVDQDALNFLVDFFTFDKLILKSTKLVDAPKDPKKDDTFFQYVNIQPVTLKIDYKPKYINYSNLKEGQLAELINLFSLDGAEMSLCSIKLTGITGIDPLLDKIAQAWLPHIKQTQVPHMVSGVAPIRSLTNLGTGVADLVLLPVQQYRKDGRIIRGLQKGTLSFARATAIEAIKLSSRIASGTQIILEHADEFFAPHEQQQTVDQHFVYTDENMAQTILAVPTDEGEEEEEEEQSSQNVIRAVPVAVIRPMIGLTGAFQSIFNGLRNSIDPVRRLQSEDVSA